MSELPASWAEVTLGELCDVVSGSTPRTTIAEYWGGDIPWITPDDLSGYARKTISRGSRSITDLGYESCSTRMVPAGTVLFTSRAPIGYVAIASQPVCTNQGFKSFVPSNGLVSDYVYWFLKYATPDVRQLGSGTTFPELSKARAIEISVPVPPLAEQHRVVAAIEEQFSRIEAAEASLLRARSRLAQVRRAAYSTGAGGDWPIVSLGSLLREPLRNGHSAKAAADGVGVRTLTLTAVTKADFSDANTKMTTADPARVRDLWLECGDILIERANTSELVGSAALFRGPSDWAIFPDLLIRVRVAKQVLPEFLAHVLCAEPARRYFRRAAQGIAGNMPKIDQGVVERLPVALPPPDEQRRMVATIDRQLSISDAMAEQIDNALRRAAALRRSILERAFTGRLVPQDPSDEPASVLLERIAAERAPPPKPRAPRRRRASARA